jgi:hypothetical protein
MDRGKRELEKLSVNRINGTVTKRIDICKGVINLLLHASMDAAAAFIPLSTSTA